MRPRTRPVSWGLALGRVVVLAAVVGAVAGSGALPGPVGRPAAALVEDVCRSGPTHVDGVPRFWTRDRTCYRSPWFAGAHRLLIPYGCTRAPYYAPDPRCRSGRGFHHGLDVDLPTGTRVFAAVDGRVVKGTLGSAYGAKAFLIRTPRYDYVLGHVGRVLVSAGERVRRGDLVARSAALGAPDGPHLHLEVRPRNGSYRDAVDPWQAARLRPAYTGPGGCC